MNEPTEDEGPGWLPAIMAGMALMGIIGFIACAFSTWLLFQKRTEFAIRTLQGDYTQQLEQSLLDPASKASVLSEVKALIADMERGKYEDWQAAGIMQRLQRLPVLQWGELQAIEAFLSKSTSEQWSGEERQEGRKQLGRLRRAVELGKVTSFDFVDILEPVGNPSSSNPGGFELSQPLTVKGVQESIRRAKLLADRSQVPDEDFQDIRIERILRQEIEQGASAGGY